jgi:hypothetical protein
MDEQLQCARQAKYEFARGGWKVNTFTNFKNHYSPKLGKCFYEVIALSMLGGKTPSDLELVGDAFEGTLVAKYGWQIRPARSFGKFNPGIAK